MSATLVSIIGPPAAGKTTLAEGLAGHLGAEVLYEDYAGNPFLGVSYTTDASAKLPAQVYFLMARAAQLALPSWPGTGTRISDYGFCHDRMYARQQLDADDWALYDALARRIEPRIKPPDVLIAVDAATDELRRRIGARGRRFEQGMDRDFLQAMRDACSAVAAETDGTVTLRADQVDFRDAATVAAIAEQVRQVLSPSRD
ncbi:MAG: deoxynucleoside kinase [Phycisphaerae bacterium]|nr:deoxynucleoside kinase [Phycisphaerae bacterium]